MIDLLKAMPLFQGLDEEALRGLTDRAVQQKLKRGDQVFREGELGDRIYLILDGKVKITRASPDGRESLLAILGPGELFGELSVFDPSPRTATATALDALEIASVTHDQIKPWIGTRPEASEILLRALAKRLRLTNDSMSDLIFTDVPGRVAKALLSLAERFGVESGTSVIVEHGLTQEELAQFVGASRETVNKALADFAHRGWLILEQRQVTVLDRERLARRAR